MWTPLGTRYLRIPAVVRTPGCLVRKKEVTQPQTMEKTMRSDGDLNLNSFITCALRFSTAKCETKKKEKRTQINNFVFFRMTIDFLKESIARTNEFFGGLNPHIYRAFLTQGELDPRRHQGPSSDLNSQSPVVIMPRKNFELFQVKNLKIDFLRSWTFRARLWVTGWDGLCRITRNKSKSKRTYYQVDFWFHRRRPDNHSNCADYGQLKLIPLSLKAIKKIGNW